MKLSTRVLSTRVLFVIAALAATAPSQEKHPSHPYGDGSDRALRVYDLRSWIQKSGASRDPVTIKVDVFGGDEPANERRSTAIDVLARSIETFVQPPFEGPEELRTIAGTHVIAVARPEQHDWIEKFLERQTERATQQLLVEVRLLTLPRGATMPPLKEGGPEIALNPSSEPMILDRERAAQTLLKWRETDGVSSLAAPSVLCMPGQRMSLYTMDETAYVKDYQILTIRQDGQDIEIADPVVAVIRAGMHLEGSVAELADDRLAVDFKLTQRDLHKRPIPTVEVPIGRQGRKVTIQRPSWSEFQIDAASALADKQTLQFVTITDDGLAVMWVTVARVGE